MGGRFASEEIRLHFAAPLSSPTAFRLTIRAKVGRDMARGSDWDLTSAEDRAQTCGSKTAPGILPLEPRGLNRVKAAAYIDVCPTKFDELVQRGLMPPPKRIDRRKVWDRRKLDEAFEALPDDGSPDANSWDGVLHENA